MGRRDVHPNCRVVPHRSTTPAQSCFTSLFGWEAVSQADMAALETRRKKKLTSPSHLGAPRGGPQKCPLVPTNPAAAVHVVRFYSRSLHGSAALPSCPPPPPPPPLQSIPSAAPDPSNGQPKTPFLTSTHQNPHSLEQETPVRSESALSPLKGHLKR